MERGADFVIRKTLPELVAGMNQLGGNLIDAAELEREVVARDREIDNKFGKDAQVMAIRAARSYLGDKLIRVAKPHRILDPAAGPLIAVQLWVLTRKTLGGLADRSVLARAAGATARPCPASMRRARSRASAAAACTAIARSKARSWADVSFQGGLRGVRPRRLSDKSPTIQRT